MIYVDVTGACLLPLQSGIPRTTRGIYRLLREQMPEKVTPVFWQPFRGSYTKLSDRAWSLLDDPFTNGKAKKAPRDSTVPILWASFSDLLGPWPQALPLHQLMQKEDTLLLTSIFPDNRLGYLRRLAENFPGQKIAIFHDAIPLRDPNVSGWEKNRHLKALRLLSEMDRVIAVSQAAGNEMQALWLEHDIKARASVVVIPWPVPFTGPRPEFSPPPFKKKKILYVSRLKQVKNHALLFTACEKLWSGGRNFELELIGCEDEATESHRIIQEVARLRHEGRSIAWRGHVMEEELHDAYRQATFTVFPSLAEGFGLPVIESFWHGRPVVCSDRDAVGELARDGGCLTADVTDLHQLAAALDSLLQDETKCAALAKEAYERPLHAWADYWRDLKPVLENR